MSWTEEDAAQADAWARSYLSGLYAAGRYRELCEDYCHEGFDYWMSEDGRVDAGICSYRVESGTEEECLRKVADHIQAEVLEGILGC